MSFGMTLPFTRELVTLPSGLSLETSLCTPKTQSAHEGDRGLIVCLHPWSRLGGNIDDPVLSYLIDPILERHNYYVLRFNSRGVGKSSGWASFTGLTEGKDLEELIKWALEIVPAVKSLVLLGYSYGSLITSLYPVLLSEIRTSHILLSYPLGPRTFLTGFNSDTYTEKLQGLIRDPRSNVLVVYGDHDEFTGDARYRSWVDELKKDNSGETLCIARIEGATHFWGGQSAQKLAQVVTDWVSTLSHT